jgi:hypothetical protein
MKSSPVQIKLVLFAAFLFAGWPVEPFITAARTNVASRLADSGEQPQITTVKILRLGQPVDYLVAGTESRQYKLEITGQGFDSSSKALLNGKKIRTTVLGATEIMARPRGVELTVGELSLQVVNGDGGQSGTLILDVVSKPSVLSISTISPAVAQVGASVTLMGIGFTPTGNRLRFVRAASPDLRGVSATLDSSDSGTFGFNVPDLVCVACPNGDACPTVCFPLSPGEYLVAVENANGLSNSLSFLVSSATGPIGFWGGDGIAVIVTDTQVQVQGDCFSGLIPQALTTDATGNFNMSGIYQLLGGPVRQGQQDVPAQFSGSINGNIMVMSITVDSQFSVGPFSFTFGDYEVIVHPCL